MVTEFVKGEQITDQPVDLRRFEVDLCRLVHYLHINNQLLFEITPSQLCLMSDGSIKVNIFTTERVKY